MSKHTAHTFFLLSLIADIKCVFFQLFNHYYIYLNHTGKLFQKVFNL